MHEISKFSVKAWTKNHTGTMKVVVRYDLGMLRSWNVFLTKCFLFVCLLVWQKLHFKKCDYLVTHRELLFKPYPVFLNIKEPVITCDSVRKSTPKEVLHICVRLLFNIEIPSVLLLTTCDIVPERSVNFLWSKRAIGDWPFKRVVQTIFVKTAAQKSLKSTRHEVDNQ